MPRVFDAVEFRSYLASREDSIELVQDTLQAGKAVLRCRVHDRVFLKTPGNLRRGQMCPACGEGAHKRHYESAIATVASKLLERFRSAHGGRYDYSRVDYRGAMSKVEIVCPDHGPFFQLPSAHSKGHGCDKCAQDVRVANREASALSSAVPSPEYEGVARTRKEAAARGDSRYFTGKPCARGHIALRNAKGGCIECSREDGRAPTEQRLRWIKEHRESGGAAEYHRQWYANNSEKVRATAKKFAEANPERVAAYKAAYKQRQQPLEYTAGSARALRAQPLWANKAAIAAMYDAAQRISSETGVLHHVDHDIPLRGALVCGLHVESNLKVIPAEVNLSKGGAHDGVTRREVWEKFSSAEIDTFVDGLAEGFRSEGFPYYDKPTTSTTVRSVVAARSRIASMEGVVGDTINVVRDSTSPIISAFFPHMWGVKCGRNLTPEDIFWDDIKLREVIRAQLRYGTNMSKGALRKALSTYAGGQRAANFRPLAAAVLYERYAGKEATVYDPCAGWGGRLAGAAIARNVRRYIGCDPSRMTHAGLNDLAYAVANFVDADLIQGCAEDLRLSESVDMVFTSPPYFDHEKYADESTQSYVRWPTKDTWIDGFFSRMVRNGVDALRNGGVFALNIASVPTYNTLVDEAMDAMLREGLVLVETLVLPLSAQNARKKSGEPVFVFVKP